VVALLKELGNEQLMGNLFVDLLKAFVDMRRQAVDREIAAQGEPQGDDDEEQHQPNTERYAKPTRLRATSSTAMLTWCQLFLQTPGAAAFVGVDERRSGREAHPRRRASDHPSSRTPHPLSTATFSLKRTPGDDAQKH
jgi:hypothetical protein